MSISKKQLKIAQRIDTDVNKLRLNGSNDMEILGEMSGCMLDVKKLLDANDSDVLNELCNRYEGFYYFVNILENLAGAIESGDIRV